MNNKTSQKNNPVENEKFFDLVSEFYDEMISFDKSLVNRQNALKKFITPSMKTAADLGCGTGLDSISLTKLGLKVKAFDSSALMISRARQNAAVHGCNIDFKNLSIDKLKSGLNNKFDIAVSLGNTLLNLDKAKLTKTLKLIHGMLNQGGLIVIQVLNFDLLRKENKRILKISSHNGNSIVRFYDIFKDFFHFNILKFNSENPARYDLLTTKLYSHNFQFINKTLKSAGFGNINAFGDLNLNKFDRESSNDIIFLAQKIN